MKKLLFTLAVATVGFSAVAQNDAAISLNSPTAGNTIGPGLAFTFDVDITNLGTQAITTSDTVLFFPTLNGGLLQTVQNGQTVPVVFGFTGATLNTNDMRNESRNFGGLSITNAAAQNFEWCGGLLVSGPNWSGVTESDTTNNFSCDSVAYDPNGGGVGIAENILTGNIKVQTLDGSYSDGNIYYLNVFNVGEPQVSVRFLDLTGRTLAMQCFQTESNEAHGQYSLASFPKGMVLASVEVNGKVINTKKIMVK